MELFRALGALAEPPSAAIVPIVDALGLQLPRAEEYTRLFAFELYPYASIYLGAEGMLGGEARDRIAGFWRALGQDPPNEPDHLAVMLALYARLAELEEHERDAHRREAHRAARKAYLWEHVLSWLPPYLTKLSEIAAPPYLGWGALLTDAVMTEAARMGFQQTLSLHLREAPALADPRSEGVNAFLEAMLSPVRSGMLLVRADLVRAAQTLQLGVRVGDRKIVLRTLIGGDSSAALQWLSAEARAWMGLHGERVHVLGDVARFWQSRAEGTASLLDQLARDAEAYGWHEPRT